MGAASTAASGRCRLTKPRERGETPTPIWESPKIPSVTYRLQLSEKFKFGDAESIVGYLDRLGISDLYSSPLLKARRGSTHGYDVVDHGQLNPEIGTEVEFDSLVAELQRRGMGLLLDIVPNHMSTGEENGMWMDVLEYGPFSPFADFFDIRWSREAKKKKKGDDDQSSLENRVLLPILLDEYGKVLRSGGLKLEFVPDSGVLRLCVHEGTRVPLTPSSYSTVLELALAKLNGPLARRRRAASGRVRGLIRDLQERMPGPDSPVPERRSSVEPRRGRRYAELLRTMCVTDTELGAAVRDSVEQINDSPPLLDSVLKGQFYRLAYWRTAAREINYRRFLTVNDLVAIRVEEMSVFREAHSLIFELIGQGKVTGLRIDHPDGLWDPTEYFRRLQQEKSRATEGEGGSGDRPRDGLTPSPGPPTPPLYVVAEKILASSEPLDERWAIHGTTGYDFMNRLNRLFVRPDSAATFDRVYSEFVGEKSPPLAELEYRGKKHAIRSSMVSELNNAARSLSAISAKTVRYRHLRQDTLARAIGEAASCFPVYRTYLSPRTRRPSKSASRYIESAIEEAERRDEDDVDDARAWELLREVLLLRLPRVERGLQLGFAMGFQQLTSPVMVKGVEDTAFYQYNRLVSLNEVGSEPDRFGSSVEEFHDANEERGRLWPHAMLATTTHDTKRSEDVRARINVLSEIPSEWRSAVGRWRRLNVGKKSRVHGAQAPSRNDEYLLYQTMVGAWPLEDPVGEEFTDRMVAYMQKASKEAKEHTSWIDPNPRYDAALERFVRKVLEGKGGPFLRDFLKVQRKASYFGMLNSLSQLLLKLTCPGVPDTYQGNETWDYSLVDPDNRREVDFSKRTAMLDRLSAEAPQAEDQLASFSTGLLEHMDDGLVKLYVMNRTLLYRRAHRRVFDQGRYVPLESLGPKRDHVCAFAREDGDESFVVVAPRFYTGLFSEGGRPAAGGEPWAGTSLTVAPGGRVYRNLFTGERVTATEATVARRPTATAAPSPSSPHLDLGGLLKLFPVALLVEEKRKKKKKKDT